MGTEWRFIMQKDNRNGKISLIYTQQCINCEYEQTNKCELVVSKNKYNNYECLNFKGDDVI